MLRVFEILAFLIAIGSSALPMPARASEAPLLEICRARDEKTDSKAIDDYFIANLKEHEKFSFSRPLRDRARGQARAFYVQRVVDKRSEICAGRLKLTEDIKLAPSRYVTGECGAAAVLQLFEQFMTRTALAYDENQKLINSFGDAHINEIKLKLFYIAKGSTAGLEGVIFGSVPLVSASKEQRFEWVKQEATKLGGEVNAVWGSASQDRNPLLRLNMLIAHEAVKAKHEHDALKQQFRVDSKILSTCKLK